MISTILMTSMMAGTVPAPTSIPAGHPYLLVSRLHAIDNLDKGDALGADRADFFALVTVNGKTYKTEIMAKDEGNPGWMIPMDRSTRYSKVHIALMDEDGGLEAKDDHVDINPRKYQKDLIFTYDRSTGKIRGAVSGKLGQTISSTGKGDDDKGEISFMVTKSW